ncbi:MAG: type II toxin-antitoxin system HicB family antitoxin [Lachnospiraceae bacterium]|nr:type II toxin-antitoxin system HicB family antitoxin [Lachnospiraceae bacterium]
MTLMYPVIFTATHDDKDTYLVYIPDIDGMTEGYGLENAYHMARDYMGCTFYDKDDDLIPKASDISNIDVSKGTFADAGESFVSIVDFDLDAYRRKMNKKSVRRNVSIPEWLNKAADDANINVSRVLQEALIEKLKI